MKTLAAASLAALTLIAPATATAAQHTQTLDMGAELLRQTKAGPWAVNLAVGAQLGMDDGSPPPPVKRIVLQFPQGARLNADAFPTCTEQILRRKGSPGCPRRSKLGTGTAEVDARPLLEQRIHARVEVYNGPGTKAKRTLFMLAQAKEVEVTLVIPMTVRRTTGRFGYTVDVPIPDLPTVPGANPGAIAQFAISMGGSIRRGGQSVNLVEAPTTCPRGGFPFTGRFTYADGTTSTAAAAISCLLRATTK